MVTPRKPDETDADYVARIGDTNRRWEIVLADANRAAAYMIMLAAHAREGGYDVGGLKGWQRRSAFLQGGRVGSEIAESAYGAAAALAGLYAQDLVDAVPADLGAALRVLDKFNAKQHDIEHWVSQSDIDAVANAADVVAEQLRPAIEKLRGLSSDI